MSFPVSEENLKSYAEALISKSPEEYTDILTNVDLNNILLVMMNVLSDGLPSLSENALSVEITSFEITKLAHIIELTEPIKNDLYDISEIEIIQNPLSEDVPSLSINDLKNIIPIRLSIAYEFEANDLSRIKIKGNGEIKIYRKNGVLEVEAGNEWDIEEVPEIEGEDNAFLIEVAKTIISGLIVHFIVLYLDKFLNI